MVMEYVAGETCEALLARMGPLPIPQAVELCDQVLDALEYAHGAGIVHRDLEPSNVMVEASGHVKVMDFGLARVAGSSHLTTAGYMVGTPAYMPPEQIRGEEVDRRMDLYSAAVMLYRLVTHHLPFEADSSIALIHAQLSNEPTPPRQFRPDLPDWIDAVLARGLAKAPANRFQTAAEFRLALERGLAGSPLTFPPAFDPDTAETVGPTPTPMAMPSHARKVAPATPSAPASSAAARTDTTVTLRTPHLVAAGVLLTLLVIAVGLLAYAALRRPITVTTVAVPSPGTAPATPSAAAVPSQSPSARPAEAQPIVTPRSAAGEPVPSQSTSAGPSPSRADVPPRRPADSAAAPAVSSALPSGNAAGRGATGRVAADANRPTESFGAIRVLVADGTKTKELEALLSLEPATLVVRSRDTGAVMRTFPYRSIAAATYTQSRQPRWKDDGSVASIPKSFSGSGFFLKTARHWLALQSKSDFLILRLEDKNVRAVLSSIESRTGSQVQRAVARDN